MNNKQANQLSKTKKSNDNIPNKISEYIDENFEGGFLSDITSYKDKNGKTFYNVEISHGNSLYHMKFNSNGVLISRTAEPLMEPLEEEDYLDFD